MKRSILFLMVTGVFCMINYQSYGKRFSSFEKAQSHPLIFDRPAIDFFEGALLGNGAMGVVVTTRPDAVVLYFGHNNVWDIRIAENNREKIGTFKEVFSR